MLAEVLSPAGFSPLNHPRLPKGAIFQVPVEQHEYVIKRSKDVPARIVDQQGKEVPGGLYRPAMNMGSHGTGGIMGGCFDAKGNHLFGARQMAAEPAAFRLIDESEHSGAFVVIPPPKDDQQITPALEARLKEKIFALVGPELQEIFAEDRLEKQKARLEQTKIANAALVKARKEQLAAERKKIEASLEEAKRREAEAT